MLNNFTIAQKLSGLIVIMIAALIAFGFGSHVGLSQVSAASEEIGLVRLPSIQGLLNISKGQNSVRVMNLTAAIYENEVEAGEKFKAIIEGRKRMWAKIERGWKLYEPLPQTAEEAVLWKRFVSEWKAWQQADDQVARSIADLAGNLSAERKKELFVEYYKRMEYIGPLFARSAATLDEIVKLNEEIASANVAAAHRSGVTARTILITVFMVAIVTVLSCAFVITRSMVLPIRQAVELARAVADGDLSSNINVRGIDEVSQLLQALKSMNENLRQIVGQVRTGTNAIAAVSSQVAVGNQDLSSRTEEQASSLEETASSMEELTSTVKQNAENATKADKLAIQASQIANQGSAEIASVVDLMEAIHRSAKKIVDIISIIDGITFQTNILALNAAVEAARAGEQGRGFAVVAGEVRTLAHRSASAAKEIKLLIEDSMARVEDGAKAVNSARSTMTAVVGDIQQVSNLVGEISTACREQSTGLEEINVAVLQMDEVTQQNAALVEEAAAAADAMQNQAAALDKLVSHFSFGKLSETEPFRPSTYETAGLLSFNRAV